VKPLTEREAMLFCVAFAGFAQSGSPPRMAAHSAIGCVERMRELAADPANPEVIRFYAGQIVEPPPALFCWDGAKPTFKRVGPVEICERCQQSPFDHFGKR
jgi:hypothetical protein